MPMQLENMTAYRTEDLERLFRTVRTYHANLCQRYTSIYDPPIDENLTIFVQYHKTSLANKPHGRSALNLWGHPLNYVKTSGWNAIPCRLRIVSPEHLETNVYEALADIGGERVLPQMAVKQIAYFMYAVLSGTGPVPSEEAVQGVRYKLFREWIDALKSDVRIEDVDKREVRRAHRSELGVMLRKLRNEEISLQNSIRSSTATLEVIQARIERCEGLLKNYEEE